MNSACHVINRCDLILTVYEAKILGLCAGWQIAASDSYSSCLLAVALAVAHEGGELSRRDLHRAHLLRRRFPPRLQESPSRESGVLTSLLKNHGPFQSDNIAEEFKETCELYEATMASNATQILVLRVQAVIKIQILARARQARHEVERLRHIEMYVVQSRSPASKGGMPAAS